MKLPPVARIGESWSLRARVVTGVVALLSVLAIVIGLASVGLLNQQLVRRLDAQLTQSSERSGPGSGDGALLNPCRSGSVAQALSFVLRGQASGAVGALSCDGGSSFVATSLIDANGQPVRLSEAQARQLVSGAGDQPDTVSLGDLGDYRVVARRIAATTTVTVIGLPMTDVEAITAQMGAIIAIVTILAVLLAVALGLLVVGVALRPLSRVAETATRVSELPLEDEASVGQRVPDADARPTTEVGRVGAALNRLLDRVETALTARTASEQKLRRFVADASHELRTPLASIRGYAELSRRFDGELPDDVRHSLERIGSESERMTSLVEDLLLLARLDAGAAMVHEPVDLGRLLVDAVSDAQAAGPEHRWTLELPDTDEDDAAPPVLVPGDGKSLHQVIANLLGNARTHTPQGTVVSATLRVPDGEAVIEIADDGPGISEDLQPRLFERFVRGDDSRSRAAGSTGLGLSIARAVVAAHTGELSVRSAPGRTVFQVRLPLEPAVGAETTTAAAS
ncbi:MAG: HAMP domain-containing histidine kinase [Micrococcales bacterium]|nr:HAMP domain-containing histidine kinase [Micrococcales bacterium]